MAELTITASSVIPVDTGSTNKQIAQLGEAVTQGQVVYQKASTGSSFFKAQCDGTAEESGVGVTLGIALSAGSTGQYITILLGGNVAIGATVVAGTQYYVGPTAGGIGLFSDISTGGTNYVTLVGLAASTTVLTIAFNQTGILKA